MELPSYYKVYPVAPTINMKKIQHRIQKSSVLMLDLKILKALLIFCGKYFEISSSKLTSIIFRIYCFCTSLLTFYIYVFMDLKHMDPSYGVLRYLYIVTFVLQHQVWLILSQVTGLNYFFTYISTILTCDSLMDYKKRVFISKNAFLYLLFTMVLSTLNIFTDIFISDHWSAVLDNNFENGIVLLFNQHYTTNSFSLISLTIVFVVGMVQNRIMLLRETLENNPVPVNIVSKNETLPKLRVVRKCIINYNNLLDAFDAIDSPMQLCMLSNLLFNLPLTVILSYLFLKLYSFLLINPKRVIMDVLRFSVSMFGPCIFCEMCYNEVDKLKAVLTIQLIRCSDAELQAELQRALDCVTRRPFNFRLLRALRVDIQLPVAIFALNITYTILLIQFTHYAF